ncbi:MAG: putative transport system ATP-binding protein [Acidobacteriota bacterium]|nr:putative transport system ATP-binding protein [Acidobacteriota bacterium]
MTDILNGKDLKKTYLMGKTEVQALRGIDVEVHRGEFVVFAGPSGSGKTTLLNLCGLIDTIDSGSLLFEGEDMSSTPERKLVEIRKNKIGFIFQNFNLAPVWSAYENVEFPLMLLKYPAAKRKELVKKYLERVGIWERRHHKPSQLSGGEQQRVAIARALVKQPRLVIADEPTANLDSHNTAEIIRLMNQLNSEEGLTFLIASHDPLVIQAAQRVMYMRDGKADGHDRVLTDAA